MGINKQTFAEKLLSTTIPSNLPVIDQQKRIESLQQNAHSLLPDRLFRFRTCSERSFDAFNKDELWVSTADCMNDGYDTRIYVDSREVQQQMGNFFQSYSDVTKLINNIPDLSGFPQQLIQGKEQIQALSEDSLRKIVNDFLVWITTDTAQALLQLPLVGQQATKFCCFSENIHSPSMWGIYALDESGFALEYDFSQMPYAESPDEHYSRECSLFPVIYGEERFKVPTDYVVFLLQYRILYTALIQTGLFQSNPSFARNYLASGVCPDNLMITKISLHKSNEWEREAEWRLFCTSINDMAFQNDKHGCCIKKPTALYLGRRIKPINEKILRTIADEKSIPVYKMILDDNSPSYVLQVK